jgi:polysaccharide biosynthesis/export protein
MKHTILLGLVVAALLVSSPAMAEENNKAPATGVKQTLDVKAADKGKAPLVSAAPAEQQVVKVAGVLDYIIGPGDVLDISVWKDEALTRTVVVLPDGRISFPLIGEVVAGGKTLAQLKSEIERKLARYVPDMVLSLEVKQCNSLLVYVLGRVNNPGRFVLNANVNVLQALAMAGGLNPFAKKDDIRIFRHERGKTTIFPFRYSEVAEGNRLEENIWLRQGDLILVP